MAAWLGIKREGDNSDSDRNKRKRMLTLRYIGVTHTLPSNSKLPSENASQSW
jgi:hypothetical protein